VNGRNSSRSHSLARALPKAEPSSPAAIAESQEAARRRAEKGWEADPDVQLMLRARDGDQPAFRELFLKHSEPMLSFACRYVGNRARAEELVQEAFLQIYRARRNYEARARFVTYAYRVVLNLCLNELRRFEYQGKTESLETNPFEDGGPPRELPDGRTPGCEEAVIGGELAGRIQYAIGELPDNQKSSLLLTRVEGLSHREVAEILDTSVSAVKSLVFRGMRTLRENLRDVLE
jgi:RNA polymerase sigma-70 factor (ECF subfamily)